MGSWNRGRSPHHFLPFAKARKVVHGVHFRTADEYDAECRNGQLDADLFPLKPQLYYKKSGEWNGWYDVSGDKIFMKKLLNLLRSRIEGLKGNIRKRNRTVQIGNRVSHNCISYELYLGFRDTSELARFISDAKTSIGLNEKEKRFKSAIKV